MSRRRAGRLSLLLSVFAVMLAYAVLVPLKLRGDVESHMSWAKVLVGPPLAFVAYHMFTCGRLPWRKAR
jgi:hypothetical protein